MVMLLSALGAVGVEAAAVVAATFTFFGVDSAIAFATAAEMRLSIASSSLLTLSACFACFFSCLSIRDEICFFVHFLTLRLLRALRLPTF